jgi:hypothetical protein
MSYRSPPMNVASRRCDAAGTAPDRAVATVDPPLRDTAAVRAA